MLAWEVVACVSEHLVVLVSGTGDGQILLLR